MSQRVLVIYYSQSGQLGEIVDSFIKPFAEAGIHTEVVAVSPRAPFRFPWTAERFFDAMPESVLGIPAELAEFSLQHVSYDLIVFAYQPWFLSPSIPATSLLLHPSFRAVLHGSPVVTLIGARNMWLNAQEKVKQLLREAGARLVGNIVLVDRHPYLISAVSIVHWMFSGRKERFLKVFPLPGVAPAEVEHAKEFGATVVSHLRRGDLASLQSTLIEQKAITIDSDLMFLEQRAGRLFLLWARLILSRKRRRLWLWIFKYYLLIALFIVSPLMLAVNALLIKPFTRGRIGRQEERYLDVH